MSFNWHSTRYDFKSTCVLRAGCVRRRASVESTTRRTVLFRERQVKVSSVFRAVEPDLIYKHHYPAIAQTCKNDEASPHNHNARV